MHGSRARRRALPRREGEPVTSDGDAGEEPRGGPSAEAVAPLQRGLGVLRVLAAAPHAMTPSALVRETALARSTVDRIVSTLDHVGFVRADGRTVALAPPLMRLGDAYLAAAALPPGFAAAAERLADALDESVSVAV